MKTKLIILFAFLFVNLAVFSQDKVEISELIHYDGPLLYPNPATDHLTVIYGYSDEFGADIWVEFESRGLIDVFSISGQRALNTIDLSDESTSHEIPVSELLSGVYFVVLRFDEEEPIVLKVVIL